MQRIKLKILAAQAKKSEGNTFFKNKTYDEAIAKYSEAIGMDSSDVTFYSNRSACYAALEKWEEAAADGRQCIMTDKSFVKGYFRAALGLQKLGNLEAALDAVKRGLGIDSQNAGKSVVPVVTSVTVVLYRACVVSSQLFIEFFFYMNYILNSPSSSPPSFFS